ncbi:hypothetical protein NKH77_50475 [Streptomyces sp. M19]
MDLPERELPIPRHVLGELAARPVPARDGAAALLACFVGEFAGRAVVVEPSEAAWLGHAAIGLAAAFLTGLAATGLTETGSTEAGPNGPRRHGRRRSVRRSRRTSTDTSGNRPCRRRTSPWPITSRSGTCTTSSTKTHAWSAGSSGAAAGALSGRPVRPVPGGAERERDPGAVGFQDAAVFSRAFKKEYGSRPANTVGGGSGRDGATGARVLQPRSAGQVSTPT